MGLMAGLHVPVGPLDGLSDLVGLLVVFYSQFYRATCGFQIPLWLDEMADCVSWQGSAMGWNLQLDRDTSWTPHLL